MTEQTQPLILSPADNVAILTARAATELLCSITYRKAEHRVRRVHDVAQRVAPERQQALLERWTHPPKPSHG